MGHCGILKLWDCQQIRTPKQSSPNGHKCCPGLDEELCLSRRANPCSFHHGQVNPMLPEEADERAGLFPVLRLSPIDMYVVGTRFFDPSGQTSESFKRLNVGHVIAVHRERAKRVTDEKPIRKSLAQPTHKGCGEGVQLT